MDKFGQCRGLGRVGGRRSSGMGGGQEEDVPRGGQVGTGWQGSDLAVMLDSSLGPGQPGAASTQI